MGRFSTVHAGRSIRLSSCAGFQTARQAVCTGILLSLVSLSAAAQDMVSRPMGRSLGQATPSTPALTAADLTTFLDGVVPLELQQADVAGAVVAVVKGDDVLFMKGYGYADVARHRPVSPDSTLFRPGSISKLVTWTAVMQQVERGRLDLDRDINDYLDFRIPPAFGQPITLRDLMTHRAGFEETAKDLFVPSANDLEPLGRYVASHLPARIYPPGTTPAYSNYGATLAGYIVQRVSGQPFDDYVEQHILTPLGMSSSTFRQPLPPALVARMSAGYDRASEHAKPFENTNIAPGGGMSTSASDMTHFMSAHLGHGRWHTAQILQASTVDAMHTRQPGWPAPARGAALGFYEESRNGHRIIGHGGDTDYFHSGMHLILDADVGVFISCNSSGRAGASAPDVIFDRFMRRYFPDSTPYQATLPTALADARRVAGAYMSSRRAQTTVRSITAMLNEIAIDADPTDSTIVIDAETGLNGLPKHYREVAPLVFREVDGPVQIAFTSNPRGQRTAYMDFPFEVFQHVDHITDSRAVNVALLKLSIGIFALTILAWPAAGMVRAHYGRDPRPVTTARRLQMLVRGVCVADLVFAGLALLAISHFGLGEIGNLGPAGDIELRVLQALGLLAICGTLVVAYNAVRLWSDPHQWVWYKVWNTGLALACAAFAWCIVHWHVLTLSLNY